MLRTPPETKERTRLEDELHRVTGALTALAKTYMQRANRKLVLQLTKSERFHLQDERELQPRRGHAGQKCGQRRKKRPGSSILIAAARQTPWGSSFQIYLVLRTIWRLAA